jgi:hypothetical protein
VKIAPGIVITAAATIVVVAAVAAALWIVGSPATERLRRADERRVDDLRTNSESIDVYFTRNHGLPADLHATEESGLRVQTTDPVSGRPYEYRVVDGTAYQLCAVFETAQTTPSFWSHPIGRQCFELRAKSSGETR